MTKKEIKNEINKAVYIYAESLGYDMSDDNDGSCVTFSKPDRKDAYDCIEYSRSYHETYVVNWCSDQLKSDADIINEFAKQQQLNYQ
jgi:hypothetical protein